jgi:hypothetical protein
MQKGTPPLSTPTPKPAAPSPAKTHTPAPQPRPAPLKKKFVPSKKPEEIKPKVGKNVLMCSLYALIVLIVIGVVILIGVAKTGLFKIPFVSNLYKGPVPTRLVEAGVMEPDAFIDQISSSVSAAIQRGEKGPYIVPFSEVELTAAARGGLADVIREDQAIVERPQIVVTPEYIEASGKFYMDNATADILIKFIPFIEENELRLDISEAYLGDIPVSPDLAKSIQGVLFVRDFGSWSINVGTVSLKDVNLKDGELELILDETK